MAIIGGTKRRPKGVDDMPDLFNDTDALAGHVAHLELLVADEHSPTGIVSPRTLAAVTALVAEYRDLRDVAKGVRLAQRLYFRTRGTGTPQQVAANLEASKALERKLDAMLKE